ncbi:serine/threonine kinase, partial [Streptomyces spongiae]|nr:serine/threonine kinase [Streptomyces spongiae]
PRRGGPPPGGLQRELDERGDPFPVLR